MAGKPTVPRWRLDAVALTLLAVGGVFAIALGTSRCFTGAHNLLDGPGEFLAALAIEPLGCGALAVHYRRVP